MDVPGIIDLKQVEPPRALTRDAAYAVVVIVAAGAALAVGLAASIGGMYMFGATVAPADDWVSMSDPRRLAVPLFVLGIAAAALVTGRSRGRWSGVDGWLVAAAGSALACVPLLVLRLSDGNLRAAAIGASGPGAFGWTGIGITLTLAAGFGLATGGVLTAAATRPRQARGSSLAVGTRLLVPAGFAVGLAARRGQPLVADQYHGHRHRHDRGGRGPPLLVRPAHGARRRRDSPRPTGVWRRRTVVAAPGRDAARSRVRRADRERSGRQPFHGVPGAPRRQPRPGSAGCARLASHPVRRGGAGRRHRRRLRGTPLGSGAIRPLAVAVGGGFALGTQLTAMNYPAKEETVAVAVVAAAVAVLLLATARRVRQRGRAVPWDLVGLLVAGTGAGVTLWQGTTDVFGGPPRIELIVAGVVVAFVGSVPVLARLSGPAPGLLVAFAALLFFVGAHLATAYGTLSVSSAPSPPLPTGYRLQLWVPGLALLALTAVAAGAAWSRSARRMPDSVG